MKTLLYTTNKSNLSNENRALTRVYKTEKGIKVLHREIMENSDYESYYRDGNYPQLPKNWDSPYNENCTEGEYWLHCLTSYNPNRFIPGK
jgi:hypothetical protein